MNVGESLVNTEEYFKLKTFSDNIKKNHTLVYRLNGNYEYWITVDESISSLIKENKEWGARIEEKSDELKALKLEFENIQKAFDKNVKYKVFKISMLIVGVFTILLIAINVISSL